MKRNAFLFGLILCICTSVFGEAPPVERWVASYNGPGNGSDVAKFLAIDNSGNIYVTGESDGNGTLIDYATIKYSPDGNQLWVARYNGPGNSHDFVQALAVDNSGNVYVTGYSDGGSTNYDYATIKYSPDGNQLWVARYNGPGNYTDEAYALAVDSTGNVYVTGYSYGASSDYATVKYSPDGNQLWVARYNGPGNIADTASAIAIDNSGNVYVTGSSFGISTFYDYATIKYSPDGNQLWVARYYNTPGLKSDMAVALAVDISHNVYVTGYSESNGTGTDYVTIKYNSDGNQLWVARYDGPAHGNDEIDGTAALAIDSSGNVYVTGQSPGIGTNIDYATVKYSPDGNQLWVARYNGPANDSDFATAVAVDNSGKVYVTGYDKGIGTNSDCTTIKYGSDGNQLWVAHYNGAGNSYDDGYAVAVNNLGNVYVAGYSAGDYATIKYTQHGICLSPIAGDLNNDCKVDFQDFAVLASHWLKCNYALQEDCP